MGITGNGASYSILAEAGIEDADLMIAVTESDELNLLCCVIAKSRTVSDHSQSPEPDLQPGTPVHQR